MTEPLVSKEVSLEAYPSFQLNTSKLLSSEFLANSTGDEFKGAIKLWCQAWKQTPASSLPNDDRTLAEWSGLGAKWKRSREKVLRDWVLCDDGRLYHPTLAEDARRCWESHLTYLRKKEAEKNKKQGQRGRNVPGDVPGDTDGDSAGTEIAIPEGQDRDVQGEIGSNININNNSSVLTNVRTDDPGGPSRVVDVGKQVWDVGLKLLAGYGIPEKRARPILGKWCKAAGSESKLLEVLNEAGSEERAEIVPFVEAMLKPKNGQLLVDRLYGLQGGPMKRTTAEFQVESWVSTLGLEAVTEAITKAKSVGWKRDKTIEHLDDLAAGKTRDNYQKRPETKAETTPAEDPHWTAVKANLCSKNPKAKSFLPMIRSVYVNEKLVKIRASNRFAVGHIEENYAPMLLELFKTQKPGIEKIEVAM